MLARFGTWLTHEGCAYLHGNTCGTRNLGGIRRSLPESLHRDYQTIGVADLVMSGVAWREELAVTETMRHPSSTPTAMLPARRARREDPHPHKWVSKPLHAAMIPSCA